MCSLTLRLQNFFSCSAELTFSYLLAEKISCSAELNMTFSLLINMKMPTIVGSFIFIKRKISCSAIFSKKEFAIVSNFRFISKTNIVVSGVEHEKRFYTWGPVFDPLGEHTNQDEKRSEYTCYISKQFFKGRQLL